MNKDRQLIFEAYCEATSFDWSTALDISALEVFHDSESTIAGQGNLSGHPEGPETAPIGDEDVNIYQAEFNKEEWPGLSTGDRVKWSWSPEKMSWGGAEPRAAEVIKQGIVVRIDDPRDRRTEPLPAGLKGTKLDDEDPSVLIIREMPMEAGTMPDLKPRE
jgi:hypothetical protein